MMTVKKQRIYPLLGGNRPDVIAFLRELVITAGRMRHKYRTGERLRKPELSTEDIERGSDPAPENATQKRTPNSLRTFLPLLPSILGFAFGRAGLIVASYGSYRSTDEGLFTDGAMMAAIITMVVLAALMYFTKFRFSKPQTNLLMRVCCIVEAAILVAMPLTDFSNPETAQLRFLLSSLITLTAAGCLFYWLRRARGCESLTATVYAFAAIAISEVVIYLCGVLGFYGYFLAAAFVLAQLPCMALARKRTNAYGIRSFTPELDYFGVINDSAHSKRLLSATAVSLGTLFVVVGFLRGYPDGASIAFHRETRIAYGLLTIAIAIMLIVMVAHRRKNVMTVGMFILFETMAAGALLLYAVFPESLDIGAVLTTSLNALMCAFMWYITIAFMGFGWRDPYYYALGGWIICMGCRCVARVAFITMPFLTSDDILIHACMGFVIIISVQVALGLFLNISRTEAENRERRYKSRLSQLEQQLAQAGQGRVVMVGAGNDGASGSCASCDADCLSAADMGMSIADILPKQPAAATSASEGGNDGNARQRSSTFTRLMGLDSESEHQAVKTANPATEEGQENSHQAVIRRKAERVGEQFLLSDREVEVLSLYALGWTQKRVAEELFISPGTAHAHIKRIYAKTDLHSRQEILDYMEQYAD